MDMQPIYHCLNRQFQRRFEQIFVHPVCQCEEKTWHVQMSTPLDLTHFQVANLACGDCIVDQDFTCLQHAAMRFMCGYFDQAFFDRPYYPVIDRQYQINRYHTLHQQPLLKRGVNALTIDLAVRHITHKGDYALMALDCYGEINQNNRFYFALSYFGHCEGVFYR